MNVAVLHDPCNADGSIGGAELTMREFVEAKPADVELGDLPEAETVVLGNCVSFGPDLPRQVWDKRVVWYHNDLSPHINPELKAWLDLEVDHVFCSPLHRDRYGHDGHLVPPAIDLARFSPSRQVRRNGDRKPLVSIGAWQNPGKGQPSLLEYAEQHGPIDVYGPGNFAPVQPPLEYHGPVYYGKVPELLWGYQRFVHLPWDVEPFGRAVVEAWAAGLELVINRLVGARYWLEEQPDKLRTAAEDFWGIVCD